MSSIRPLEGKKILIVDDEPLLREVIRDEFESMGAFVQEADGGRKALNLIKAEKVDAVVSDIQMPDGDGIELLTRVRAEVADSPVVFLITGYSTISEQDAYEKGASGYFTKPLNIETLGKTLVRALESPDKRWSRRHDRLPVQETLKVHFSGQGDQEGGSQTSSEGTLVNLGKGGFFVSLKDQFPAPGQILKFSFEFGKAPPLKVEGLACVRWVRAQSQEGLPAGMGLEFLEIEPSSLSHLQAILSSISTQAYIPKK